ncbi:NAD(P)/FAD-dependent oxidoreductase [Gorillibacterium timonense]|uniref:NAD(P)/FAD-dependent oxidoreductase n=1 Tax=Gorillibacterium timonense TaxID=1689269 RepID=UPI00071C4626|nr:FAD-dependent oxidoreductase [Gorillibacterium timonense]
MRKVVVAGGGYGGLTIVNELLSKEIPDDVHLTLVDRMPFQGLKTEYYALASGTVADQELRIAFPEDARLTKRYGDILQIDLSERLLHLADQEPLSYDTLIIALGCTDHYHGVPGAEENTCTIQSFSSARTAYQRLCDIRPYGQVTVVGGGLSGVELAAELRESRSDLHIRILDRGPGILSSFPEKLQHYTRKWFLQHEVELRGHVALTRVERSCLHNGEEEILSDEMVWTAGIQPSPLVQQLNVPKDARGRIVLNALHQIPDYPEVYVVGDCASLVLSPSAQAAEAQGKQIAEVLLALWSNETPRLGAIKLKGVLGSLGKRSGFGVMGEHTVLVGKIPRTLKSGVLWMSKRHFG